jgi:site-specific recombinase XerD
MDSKHPPTPNGSKVTLSQAIEGFLSQIRKETTTDTYSAGLGAFRRFISETGYGGYEAAEDDADSPTPIPLDLLHDDVLVAFYAWLADTYSSSHTVRTYLSALRRFLIWCDAQDFLPVGFQMGKAQSRLKATPGVDNGAYHHRLVDPEIPRIVTYYDRIDLPQGDGWNVRQKRLIILRNRAIVHTLYASAGRVSEVAALTREMVLDGRLDEIQLTGKGDQTRMILLTPGAMQAIQDYIGERDDKHPALFISHGRGRGNPLSRQTIWSVVKGAAEALGLHDTTSPHSFRHYRATQLLNEGMPLESVQAYLGHKDISTTRRVYAHTRTETLRTQLDQYGRSPDEALEDLARRRRDRQRSS